MEKKDPRFGYYRANRNSKNGLKDWYEAADRPEKLLEIGSATGDSAETFYECNNDIRMVCIDPWNYVSKYVDLEKSEAYDYFVNRFKDIPNILPIRAYSQDIVYMFPDGYFDSVYIDANHNYEHVQKDIKLCLPLIKKGGYIGGHDYESPRFDGCVRAVDEFAESIGKEIQTFADDSWLVKL